MLDCPLLPTQIILDHLRYRLGALLLFLQLFGLPTNSHSLDWTEESFGDWDGYSLDAAVCGEDLFISAYNRISGDLTFSEKVDGTWTTTTAEATVSDILFPTHTESSLVLDQDGTPHIFYYKHAGSDLKHAYRVAGTWQTETIDSNGSTGGYAEAITCGGGTYCVCYQDLTNGNAMLARGSAGNWTIETIDNSENDVGSYCDLAKLSNGDLHVAYYDATSQNPKVAMLHNEEWTISTLGDGYQRFGMWNSMALDSSGNLHFASSCAKSSDTGESDCGLYLSTLEADGSWTSAQEENSSVGGHPSLAYDSTGRRVISYRSLLRSALFGHYSALWSSQKFVGLAPERGSIDGSSFCFGTFLYSRTLVTPSDATYVVYHRSYGPCGGNTAEIVVRRAEAPPDPVEPTPTPSATPTPSPTPDQSDLVPTPTPTPSPQPGGDGSGEGDENLASSLSYTVLFGRKKGALEMTLSSDNPLSADCTLAVDFSTMHSFVSKLSARIDPSLVQPIKINAVNRRLLFKTPKDSGVIHTRARYHCEGASELISQTTTIRPRTTRQNKLAQAPNKWVQTLMRSINTSAATTSNRRNTQNP